MKPILSLPWIVAAAVLAAPAAAQHAGHAGGSARTAAPAAPAASEAPSTLGEVRKVDRAGSRLTIKHETIRNLDMPPMTMVFQVRDAALLDRVKVGDKIRFHAVDEQGRLVVTAIEPLR